MTARAGAKRLRGLGLWRSVRRWNAGDQALEIARCVCFQTVTGDACSEVRHFEANGESVAPRFRVLSVVGAASKLCPQRLPFRFRIKGQPPEMRLARSEQVMNTSNAFRVWLVTLSAVLQILQRDRWMSERVVTATERLSETGGEDGACESKQNLTR